MLAMLLKHVLRGGRREIDTKISIKPVFRILELVKHVSANFPFIIMTKTTQFEWIVLTHILQNIRMRWGLESNTERIDVLANVLHYSLISILVAGDNVVLWLGIEQQKRVL